MWEFTATASRRHPNNLDGVWLEEVDPPPGTGFALGFRASFPIVFRAEVTVITMVCISASHSRRLVRRFAKTHVRTCCAIFVLLQFRHYDISNQNSKLIHFVSIAGAAFTVALSRDNVCLTLINRGLVTVIKMLKVAK